ncbi:MAG: hypothetical protein P4L64_06615 [Caulobacteraceae bacterium]|nr:hypothetical protein [Caulobacteraceae bacterium]
MRSGAWMAAGVLALAFAGCGATRVAAAPAQASASEPAAASADSPMLKALRDQLQRVAAGDSAGALATVQGMIAGPDFPKASAADRHAAYQVLGQIQLKRNDPAAALAAFDKAIAVTGTIVGDWMLRLNAAALMKDDAEVIRGVTMIARTWPDRLLPVLGLDYASSLLRRTRGVAALAPARADMLEAMLHAGWRPPGDLSRFWYDLALDEVARGRLDAAGRAADALQEPRWLMAVRADRRLDPLTRANPSRYDPVEAQDRKAAKSRLQAAALPDRLAPIVTLATDLLEANRPAEALAVLDAALAKARPAALSVSDPTLQWRKPGRAAQAMAAVDPRLDWAKPQEGQSLAFRDQDEQLAYVMDRRARALAMQGRPAEALTQWIDGLSQSPKGGVAAVMLLNTGVAYDRAALPDEALLRTKILTVPALNEAGAAQLQEVRACAYAQQGQAVSLAGALNYLREHVASARPLLIRALICGQEMGEAAQVLIGMLQDEDTRPGALVLIQGLSPTYEGFAYDVELRRRWGLLLARPDVLAAIAKVGRTELYPLADISR